MSKIEIASAFVEEAKGSPVFVLKIAEPHSRKDEQGNWQTVSRTFFDVKVSRDSGIDLSAFPVKSRIKVWGSQRTEVREHQGKKYYTLTVWADRIEPAGEQQGGSGGGFGASAGVGPSGEGFGPENSDGSAFGGGSGEFGDPF